MHVHGYGDRASPDLDFYIPARPTGSAAAGDEDPEENAAYGLAPADIARMADDFAAWAQQLRDAPD